MDFIFGILIFLVVIFLVLRLTDNIFTQSNYDEVKKESQILADALISQGYPINWTTLDVIKPGLIEEKQRISEEKLQNFQNLKPNEIKTLLGLRYEYQIQFINASNQNMSICQNCSSSSKPYDNLAIINRLVVYNGSIVTMQVKSFD